MFVNNLLTIHDDDSYRFFCIVAVRWRFFLSYICTFKELKVHIYVRVHFIFFKNTQQNGNIFNFKTFNMFLLLNSQCYGHWYQGSERMERGRRKARPSIKNIHRCIAMNAINALSGWLTGLRHLWRIRGMRLHFSTVGHPRWHLRFANELSTGRWAYQWLFMLAKILVI